MKTCNKIERARINFTTKLSKFFPESGKNLTADLLEGGLTDGVVDDPQSLLVGLQLPEHRGPGQTRTGQLVGD